CARDDSGSGFDYW
nr:immunoglobulin heavy chain junction region [Macaca mulatta]MOW45500.1 immunoglobulin heavy chain junction region [Macaca mulatta]MOW45526.1 immunoglobulin heavy chain junction region [Macaca mulatta]MOW45528.1 immunoglobulin heavy chain junction region [Macaca mulatta]MOW45656.1 immunoglobulin heavy chain junction region [Macaca mulatta]